MLGPEYAAGAETFARRAFEWWPPAVKARLCQLALEQQLEPDYARALARHLALLPEAGCGAEVLPARIEARLLGGFELHVDGDDLAAARRPPQRPLALFKCLVALGGANIDERRVADRLWPDSDGDRAAALKTTLARLRRLVGARTVRLENHRLSLDATRCRVDALAVELLLSAHDDDDDVCRHLVELYRGPFSPGDDTWRAIAYREQLQGRVVARLRCGAQAASAAGDLDRAIVLLGACLESAPDISEPRRELVDCLRRAGRDEEADRIAAHRAKP